MTLEQNEGDERIRCVELGGGVCGKNRKFSGVPGSRDKDSRAEAEWPAPEEWEEMTSQR